MEILIILQSWIALQSQAIYLLARPDSPIMEAIREESGPGASVSTE